MGGADAAVGDRRLVIWTGGRSVAEDGRINGSKPGRTFIAIAWRIAAE